jgi:hypothetical protein
MRVLGDCFPLLLGVAPLRYDAASVRQMSEAFEGYFRRGERYALVSVQPQGSAPPSPTERKALMEWLGSPRVRQYSGQLCIASAAVMENALMRGALTAVLWFWKPPFPLEVVKTPERGIDYCIEQLERQGARLPASPGALASRASRVLASALYGDQPHTAGL